jgi:hypothetical protein
MIVLPMKLSSPIVHCPIATMKSSPGSSAKPDEFW